MTRRARNLLQPSSAPPATALTSPSVTSLTLPGAGRPLTRDEARIVTEWSKQVRSIEATALKTQIAQAKITDIETAASARFDAGAGALLDIKNRKRTDKEHQDYVEQFTRIRMESLARHLSSVAEVGAANIGVEVHRSVYPEPDPPEPRGFFKRLFG